MSTRRDSSAKSPPATSEPSVPTGGLLVPAASAAPLRPALADPVNFNIKHPLFNSWTLWYDNPGKKTTAQSWSANLKELVTFDTVEDFWGVYNNIAKCTEIPAGSNYHLFKKGVRPMWEDPANAKGGKWVVQILKSSSKADDVNDIWLNSLLACIGESFEQEDEICGLVMSNRKAFYRVALWTRSSNRRDVCESIGRQFKSFISYSGKIEFQSHAEAARGGR